MFLINRLPGKALQDQVPFEKLYGKSSHLSFLKVFSCQCFASTLTANRKNLILGLGEAFISDIDQAQKDSGL